MTDQEYEQAVHNHYAGVFHFALSLTRQEAEACDLTQETFYLLASRGRQVRDVSKLKSWLMTTCYREFLRGQRHQSRFPHVEMSLVEHALPSFTVDHVRQMDAETVLEALQEIEELYRVPVMLFYLQGHSYKEMAAMLDVPVGTIMSRLARGKERLRECLARKADLPPPSAAPALHERPFCENSYE